MVSKFRALAATVALLVGFDAGAATVQMGNGSAEPGDTVTLDLSVTGGATLGAVSANLDWDGELLQLQSITPVGGGNGVSPSCGAEGSAAVFRVFNEAVGIPDGAYCRLTFLVPADVDVRAVTIDVEPDFEQECFDLGDVPCNYVDGSVTVLTTGFSSNPPPGETLVINTSAGSTGSRVLRVTSTGTQDLAVTPSTLTAPLSIAPSGTQSIPGGMPQDFTVSCTSATAGTFNQTLTLTTSDPQQPTATYPVACNVLGPEVAPTPANNTTLTLTSTQGGTAPTATVTLANGGPGSLTATPSGLSGALSVSPSGTVTIPAPFVVQSDAKGGPNQQAFTVTCATTTPGTYNQTLTFTTNDGDEGTLSYPISCAVAGPEIDTTPVPGTQLDISAAPGMPGSTTLDVRNTGSAPLDVATLGLATPFSATPGSFAVAPGATQTVTVSCAAATTAPATATLQLSSNDSDEGTLSFPVRCSASSATLGSTPPPGSTLSIATSPGTLASASLNIANNGTGGLTITPSGLSPPLSFRGPVMPLNAKGMPYFVPPGASSNFFVDCAASSAGTFNQTLTLATNDPTRPSVTYPVSCAVGAPGARTIAISGGDGQSGEPGVTLPAPLAVLLRDPNSNNGFAAGVPVTFSVVDGDARFGSGQASTTVTSDATGNAAATLVLGAEEGLVVVTATATGFGSVTFTLSTERAPPPPYELAIVSGDAQTAEPDADGAPLVVRLTQGGVPVAGDAISWRVAQGDDITLSARTSTTDNAGEAEIGLAFGDAPTRGVVEATSSRGPTARFEIRAPAAAALRLVIVSGNAQTGAAATPADQPIVFEARRDNAVVPGVGVDFRVTRGTATASLANAVTDDEGRVAVRLRYGATPGPVELVASTQGGQVTAVALAEIFPVALQRVSGDNQQAAPATQLPQPLVVQIVRPAGKGLAGAVVNWTVVTGGGTVTNASSSTDASGQARTELTLGAAPGPNQVRASVDGVGSTTFNATATAPPTGLFAIVAGDGQTLATNENSAPLTVRLTNDRNAPLANARIRWSAPANVDLSATETTTDANGQTSISASLQQPGGGTVTATAVDFANAPAVSFTLNGGIVNTDGAGESERTVAGALDQACPILAQRDAAGQPLSPAEADLLARCRELIASSGTDPGDTNTVLQELLADEATAQNNAALTVQAAQFDNLKARLAALRSGTQGASFGGLALTTDEGAVPLSFLPSAILGAQDEGGTADGGEVGGGFSRWGFFATGTIGRGGRDPGERDPGFDFDTIGLTAGVDYRWSDHLVLGAALGYNKNETDLDGDAGGLDADGYSFSGYATWYQGDSFYVDGVATLGRNNYDITRGINFSIANPGGGTTVVDQIASADPDGDQTSLAVSVGRDFNQGAWSFGPYLRGLYTKVDFDGYTETLSDPNAPGAGLGVTVEDRELESRQAVLGGKMSYTMSTSWGILMPHAQLEFLKEFEDDLDAVVTRFANDPTGTPIEIRPDSIDDSYFNLGFGLSGVFANGRSAFVYYEHRAAQDKVSYDNLAIGIRIEF